jgi:hypothetical protein
MGCSADCPTNNDTWGSLQSSESIACFMYNVQCISVFLILTVFGSRVENVSAHCVPPFIFRSMLCWIEEKCNLNLSFPRS